MEEVITIPAKWVERLKHYTDKVKAISLDITQMGAIAGLLGYLDSLENGIPKKQ